MTGQHQEETMLSLHKNRRRLAALTGLALTLTLAPTAAAVPILPDGGSEPDPQLIPAPAAGDPAPVIHSSPNGLEWSDFALAGAVALIAFLIAAALLFAVGRRRPTFVNWPRSAETPDRPAALRY